MNQALTNNSFHVRTCSWRTLWIYGSDENNIVMLNAVLVLYCKNGAILSLLASHVANIHSVTLSKEQPTYTIISTSTCAAFQHPIHVYCLPHPWLSPLLPPPLLLRPLLLTRRGSKPIHPLSRRTLRSVVHETTIDRQLRKGILVHV